MTSAHPLLRPNTDLIVDALQVPFGMMQIVRSGRQPTADGRPDTPAGTRTPQPLRCSKAHDVARHDQLRSRGIASRGTIRYPDAGLIRVNLE